MRLPSPEKYSRFPARSRKSKPQANTKSSLWKTFIIIGRLVVLTRSARSVPLPLKWRYLALSGIANRLFSPHSKLRRRRSAGANVEQKHIGEIAAALEMNRRAIDAAVTRPRRGVDSEQVNAVVLGDRNAFAAKPIEIGIDAVARLVFAFVLRFGLRRLGDVHALTPAFSLRS